MPKTWVDAFGVQHTGATGLETLQEMLADGSLHHATYREAGRCGEGLWLYRKNSDGFLGYEYASAILCSEDADLKAAYALLQYAGHTVHVGRYGEGSRRS